MTNDMTLFSGGPISLSDTKEMARTLGAVASEGATNALPDGGVYVSFSGKRGAYAIGQDNSHGHDPEELWLLNIGNIEHGYACWKGGQKVANRMAVIYGPPVPAPDYTEHGPFKEGEGWNPAKAFTIRSLDKGVQGYFSTNSKSGVNEFSKLEKETSERMAAGEPCWPVLCLGMEEFTAKGNKNFKPVLDVQMWLTGEQIGALAACLTQEAVGELVDEFLVASGPDRVEDEVAAAKAAAEAAKKKAAAPTRRRRAG